MIGLFPRQRMDLFALCKSWHLNPSIAPAKKPPRAGFQLSLFSRRFADAVLANSYVPPIAATESVRLLVQYCSNDIGQTKDCNCSSCSGEDTPCCDILLCECVLDCREECSSSSHDQRWLNRSADGIFGLVHYGLLPCRDDVGHGQCLTANTLHSVGRSLETLWWLEKWASKVCSGPSGLLGWRDRLLARQRSLTRFSDTFR